MAEVGRADQSLGVPGNMLPGDAHAGFLTVETVKIKQVLTQDPVNLRHFRRRQFTSGGKKMLDLAEDPGSPLGRAADHDTVGLCVIQYELRLLRRGDVAI